MCVAFPKRYIVTLLLALGMCLVHAMRVNVAVTVVTILDKNAHTKVGTLEAQASLPDVMWNSKMVGFLHAVFYIGYLLTQIPGGYLATVMPANRLFGGCILMSCSLNLLLPLSIWRWGYVTTCVLRGAQGLAEGLLYPSCYAVMRHWTTPSERSRTGSVVLTGIYLGPVIGLPISGYATHYIGWQYIYYINGGIGIFWFLWWLFLSYDTPSLHPTITKEELEKIQKLQGESAIIYEHDTVPWWDILSSGPVWALNVCNFARSFIFFLLLTNEPTYLNVFGYSLAENGVLSSLPHLVMTLIALLSGPLADLLMKDRMLTPTDVRKIFTCVGFGAEAMFLFLLVVVRDGTSALIYLTIGIGISGFTISGWQINHLDLAPRYASVLVGITTFAGTLAGIINPIVIGAMTESQSIDSWHRVFLLASCILVFAVIFYYFFGSGEKQVWAEPRPPEVRLIHKTDPMGGTVYKTVPGQYGSDGGMPYKPAGDIPYKQVQPPVKGSKSGLEAPSDTDKQSTKQSDKEGDDSKNPFSEPQEQSGPNDDDSKNPFSGDTEEESDDPSNPFTKEDDESSPTNDADKLTNNSQDKE